MVRNINAHNNAQQECIPVGWVPPAPYRIGGVSLTETTLDRDPSYEKNDTQV